MGARPEPGPLGAALEAERCRSYLFSLIPLGPRFSTEEVLEELLREVPSLGTVTVDERVTLWVFGHTECTMVRGHELVPMARTRTKTAKAAAPPEPKPKPADPVAVLRSVYAAAGRRAPGNIDPVGE